MTLTAIEEANAQQENDNNKKRKAGKSNNSRKRSKAGAANLQKEQQKHAAKIGTARPIFIQPKNLAPTCV
eukprot:CAMPEP_0198271848 /NCGR_PEP_ID=MMETSP1447-20131203/50726_1 /TAXON_ID=420782 /ORGANISM="Chaetoceros dichaeta, Strain CCMP1751" /LENGTH=69 /DNA_ID=CAMNT_0043964665 /DNA_START=44 /DNA_END=249 /DNA_ORIENTATION=+